MRALWCIPLGLFIILQCVLWFASGGLRDVVSLNKSSASLSSQVSALQEKNSKLISDIDDLRDGHEVLELNARNKLGMIKPGEVFYRVVSK